PMQATLVPEKREEVTTEGGLDLSGRASRDRIRDAVERLNGAGVRTSLFVDPDEDAIRASFDVGAVAVELHTGEYANATVGERAPELARLRAATEVGRELGLAVHAGHGLTYENVAAVASIDGIEELNIGHSIVSRALFTGLERAVRDMVDAVRRARSIA